MKHKSHFRRQGFTLVELLVVIAIIGILAAASFPVITGMINNAQRVRSGVLAGSIKTAIQAYQTEYGAYPNTIGGAGIDTYYNGAMANVPEQDLIYGLCGNINPAAPLAGYAPTVAINTRNIVYLSPNRADVDPNPAHPLIKQPLNAPGVAIQYYYIAMDTDYSNIIGDSGMNTVPNFNLAGAAFHGPVVAQISAGIAVWANNDENYGASITPNRWSHTY